MKFKESKKEKEAIVFEPTASLETNNSPFKEPGSLNREALTRESTNNFPTEGYCHLS